jgi:cell division control protein 6
MIDKLLESEMRGGRLFKDASVLSPHYVPDRLPHRKQETREIIRIIGPILRGVKPNNIFLYGKTGTGKTAVIRHVTRELKKIADDPARNRNKVRIECVYMNRRVGYNSKYQVLVKVLEDESMNKQEYIRKPLSDRGEKGRLSGLSPTELYERLKSCVESNQVNLVVVLDEVDMIKDVDDLLYILTRINDEITKGSVSIIGISNKYTFKDMLDSRSKSTLCEEELVFKPYNANQLKTILAQRVRLGFKKRAISSSGIGLIAAYGAHTNGDARYALRLLKKSGELAEAAGRKMITNDDVKAAKVKVEEDITYEIISTLPEPQQIVLLAIAETLLSGGSYKKLDGSMEGVLFSGEVYEAYERICRGLDVKSRTMRWFREYLNDLEMLGLITLSISGKGVRGNTSLIRLGNPPEEVKKIVSESLGLTRLPEEKH